MTEAIVAGHTHTKIDGETQRTASQMSHCATEWELHQLKITTHFHNNNMESVGLLGTYEDMVSVVNLSVFVLRLVNKTSTDEFREMLQLH